MSLTRALKKLLADNPDLQAEIAESVIREAIAGSARHAELAWQRIDGKVPDILRVEEHVIELLPPGVARGKYELDDDDEDGDPPLGTDEEATPSPE